MPTTALRGGTGIPANLAYTDYDNPAVYDTITWPGGNYNRDGVRICVVDAISVNTTGGITSTSVGADGLIRIFGGTPRMNFYRNVAAGGSIVQYSPAAASWGGALTGYFAWSTVATVPTGLTPVRTGRAVALTIAGSADNGGQSITAYKTQRAESVDGVTWGAWGDELDISGGSNNYAALAVARYHKFRGYAVNARGNSTAIETAAIFVPASGKRRASGVFSQMAIAKRRVAGVWQDLQIGKRKASGTFIDLGS